jgi:hypothetical protein
MAKSAADAVLRVIRSVASAADDILHPLDVGCAGFRLIDPATGAAPLRIDFALDPVVPKGPTP